VVTDKSIPIVFMSVVDPVVAKIVPSWDRGSDTHTGATLYPDFNASLAFVRQLLPNAKRLGIPFNPGEDNDISNMNEMRAAAPKHGFEIVEVGIDAAADIPQRLQSMQGKVDAVFVIHRTSCRPAFRSSPRPRSGWASRRSTRSTRRCASTSSSRPTPFRTSAWARMPAASRRAS
jgi:ABC-type uncharacterized transport system substrate-binding protein